jgi:hypothetical protein
MWREKTDRASITVADNRGLADAWQEDFTQPPGGAQFGSPSTGSSLSVLAPVCLTVRSIILVGAPVIFLMSRPSSVAGSLTFFGRTRFRSCATALPITANPSGVRFSAPSDVAFSKASSTTGYANRNRAP